MEVNTQSMPPVSSSTQGDSMKPVETPEANVDPWNVEGDTSRLIREMLTKYRAIDSFRGRGMASEIAATDPDPLVHCVDFSIEFERSGQFRLEYNHRFGKEILPKYIITIDGQKATYQHPRNPDGSQFEVETESPSIIIAKSTGVSLRVSIFMHRLLFSGDSAPFFWDTGEKFSLIGKSPIDGAECYHLTRTGKGDLVNNLWIDVRTLLPRCYEEKPAPNRAKHGDTYHRWYLSPRSK